MNITCMHGAKKMCLRKRLKAGRLTRRAIKKSIDAVLAKTICYLHAFLKSVANFLFFIFLNFKNNIFRRSKYARKMHIYGETIKTIKYFY